MKLDPDLVSRRILEMIPTSKSNKIVRALEDCPESIRPEVLRRILDALAGKAFQEAYDESVVEIDFWTNGWMFEKGWSAHGIRYPGMENPPMEPATSAKFWLPEAVTGDPRFVLCGELAPVHFRTSAIYAHYLAPDGSKAFKFRKVGVEYFKVEGSFPPYENAGVSDRTFSFTEISSAVADCRKFVEEAGEFVLPYSVRRDPHFQLCIPASADPSHFAVGDYYADYTDMAWGEETLFAILIDGDCKFKVKVYDERCRPSSLDGRIFADLEEAVNLCRDFMVENGLRRERPMRGARDGLSLG